jgi:hypothetical protein
MELALQIISQLLVTGGLLIWITKRHAEKLDLLLVDMTKANTILGIIMGDHERLVVVEQQIKKADRDLNFAFDTLRQIKGEIKQ